MEELLVGYLYGELSSEERERVEREIARDPVWEKTLEEMRGVSGLLRRMEEPEPKVRFAWTALSERRPFPRRMSAAPRLLRRRTLWSVAAGVAAAVLLILGNARVTLDEGRVAFSLGRSSSPDVFLEAPDRGVPLQLTSGGGAVAPVADYITREDFLRGQAELVRFVATLIRESEDRQADRYLATFQNYLRDAESERQDDMFLMDRRLGEMEEGTRDIMNRIDTEHNDARTGPPEEDRR